MAVDAAPHRLIAIVAAFLRRHGFSKTLAAFFREHGQVIEEETQPVDLETMHRLYMAMQEDSGDLALCEPTEKHAKLVCKKSFKRKGNTEDNGFVLIETEATEKATYVKELQNGCHETEDTSEKKKKRKKRNSTAEDPMVVLSDRKEEKPSVGIEEIEEKCGRPKKKKVALREVNDTTSEASNIEKTVSSKDNSCGNELQEPQFEANGNHAPGKKPKKEKNKLRGADKQVAEDTLGGSASKKPGDSKAGEEKKEEKGSVGEDCSIAKKRKKGGRKDEPSVVIYPDEPAAVACHGDADASADDQSSKKKKKRKKETSVKSGEGGLQELSLKVTGDAKPGNTDVLLGGSNGKVDEKRRRKKIGDNEASIAKDSKEEDLSIELTTKEDDRSGEDCENGEASEKKKTQKDEKEKTPTGALAFKRVDLEKVDFHDARLKDNSYWAKDGAEEGYGAKAQEVLGQVRGRGFRHEKTKKKRGSYRGGAIDLQSHSIKFENSDGE